ncbi:MAG: hypothetical protein GY948_07095 [Alphaproteobacteria bacterium]|nr:hypothetical protein [Alphaproteobacteria bacterium]
MIGAAALGTKKFIYNFIIPPVQKLSVLVGQILAFAAYVARRWGSLSKKTQTQIKTGNGALK